MTMPTKKQTAKHLRNDKHRRGTNVWLRPKAVGRVERDVPTDRARKGK